MLPDSVGCEVVSSNDNEAYPNLVSKTALKLKVKAMKAQRGRVSYEDCCLRDLQPWVLTGT